MSPGETLGMLRGGAFDRVGMVVVGIVDAFGCCEGFGGGRDVLVVCGGGLKRSTSGSGAALGAGRLRLAELTYA